MYGGTRLRIFELRDGTAGLEASLRLNLFLPFIDIKQGAARQRAAMVLKKLCAVSALHGESEN